ncbi:MAG: galactokinase [Odoribacteraceae bacterium]|jgi:galactokinase|nr:galactokinase [Odoribacteraceae bacterium]
MNLDELKQGFQEIYGQEADAIYFAPGRVNLIGEHTDYNGGYVFPCALNFGTYLLVSRRKDPRDTRFITYNFQPSLILNDRLFTRKMLLTSWMKYPAGVMKEFRDAGHDPWGFNTLFYGNVPYGAGLSSSASVEMVMAIMLNDQLGAGLSPQDLALACQRAENDYVGMKSGIMDQFVSAMGQKDHAILLDCKTLDFERVPLEMEGYSLVIANTNKRRELAGSKYNERRAECEEAARQINEARPLQALCDLTPDEFERYAGLVTNETKRRRARHAVTENARVKEAVAALKAGDSRRFGQLMNESHRSLKEDYEVTGVELDTLAEEAQKLPGVLGSRMTGAGFGGCTVSLVETAAIPSFTGTLGETYKQRVGLTAEFYVAAIGDGASRVE